MAIYNKIRDEKLQYDVNREAGKIDKYNNSQKKKFYHLIKKEW